jgi:type I restriction enzyme M protein
MSASRLNSIAMELSVMDKSAVVQKDRKGNVLIDPTTKDTEIIRLNQDADEYMRAEVLPHIPDAIYFYDFDETKKPSATNKEKLGAEFPFTRYFYEYHEPEKADDLLTEFMDLEKTLTAEIAELQEDKI